MLKEEVRLRIKISKHMKVVSYALYHPFNNLYGNWGWWTKLPSKICYHFRLWVCCLCLIVLCSSPVCPGPGLPTFSPVSSVPRGDPPLMQFCVGDRLAHTSYHFSILISPAHPASTTAPDVRAVAGSLLAGVLQNFW